MPHRPQNSRPAAGDGRECAHLDQSRLCGVLTAQGANYLIGNLGKMVFDFLVTEILSRLVRMSLGKIAPMPQKVCLLAFDVGGNRCWFHSSPNVLTRRRLGHVNLTDAH